MLIRPILAFSSRPFTRPSSNWAKHALYIDQAVIVVNKPAGIVCQFNRQKTEEQKEGFDCLVDDLKDKFHLDSDPFPVHRLDKRTTGSLALALTAAHARDLSQQFVSHAVEKTYVALVRGGASSFPQRSGTIRGALYISDGRVSTKSNGQWDKRAVAETDWELLASSPSVPLSLVQLRPFTGLKHQLRIHMAEVMRVPILGDTLYASAKLASKITDAVNVPEGFVYLHASKLSFFRYKSTGSNKRVKLTIGAPMPAYFTRLCDRIRIPLHKDVVKGGLWVDGSQAATYLVSKTRRQSANDAEEGSSEPEEEKADLDEKPDLVIKQLGGQWLAK